MNGVSSEKIRIRIRVLASSVSPPVIKSLCETESRIFEIQNDGLMEAQIEDRADSKENWGYSKSQFEKLLYKTEISHNEMLFVITDLPLEKNMFSFSWGSNKVVITSYDAEAILGNTRIPLKNFFLRMIYAYSIMFMRFRGIPQNEDIRNLVHDHTYRCIFHFSGQKSAVAYSCVKPIICARCDPIFFPDRDSGNTLKKNIESELNALQKPLFERMADFIKEHPLQALVYSTMSAFLIGLASSSVASLFFEH